MTPALRLFADDRSGAAAVEMALVTPFLLALLFGSLELGNYFLSEHALLKEVRDGARYAARQSFANFQTCDATPGGTVSQDTKALVRTGQLSGGTDRLPKWNDSQATFSVTTKCKTGYGGIYSGMTNGARYVVVSASLPYRPVAASVFGLSGAAGLALRASQQAAVTGA